MFNRHRISSASSDNDIHFNIGGDSDDEELTLTPTHHHHHTNAGLRRPSNSSGAESDGSSIQLRRPQLPTSPLGNNHALLRNRSVPKSASTSSIPESRLIIPNNEHHIFSNRDSVIFLNFFKYFKLIFFKSSYHRRHPHATPRQIDPAHHRHWVCLVTFVK